MVFETPWCETLIAMLPSCGGLYAHCADCGSKAEHLFGLRPLHLVGVPLMGFIGREVYIAEWSVCRLRMLTHIVGGNVGP